MNRILASPLYRKAEIAGVPGTLTPVCKDKANAKKMVKALLWYSRFLIHGCKVHRAVSATQKVLYKCLSKK